MQEFDFVRAETLDDLCRLLAETGGRVIAGGTDVLVQLQHDRFPANCLVDASQIAALRLIEADGSRVRIGALTTYADVLSSTLLREMAPALVQAAEKVGAPQTRTRGTLGGNIANASPAGDTLPPLLALDAQVHLVRLGGERTLPLAEVLIGPGRTCLTPGEVIHSISFDHPPEPYGVVYLKLGNRNGMSIAVASVAVLLALHPDGTLAKARIALGSLAPTAVRSPQVEAALTGQRPTPQRFQAAARAVQGDIAPISDVRASAEYRRLAAQRLVARALDQAFAAAQERVGV
jgi:carbon-monoxide dehydrogenase medium subunit